jgi:hypothetical protein
MIRSSEKGTVHDIIEETRSQVPRVVINEQIASNAAIRNDPDQMSP